MVTFAVIVAVHVLVLEVVMMLLGGDACFDVEVVMMMLLGGNACFDGRDHDDDVV